MDVPLSNKVPDADGYFLMKLQKTGGLHLVIIQRQLDNSRIIIFDCPTKKVPVTMAIHEKHGNILQDAYFSAQLNFI